MRWPRWSTIEVAVVIFMWLAVLLSVVIGGGHA